MFSWLCVEMNMRWSMVLYFLCNFNWLYNQNLYSPQKRVVEFFISVKRDYAYFVNEDLPKRKEWQNFSLVTDWRNYGWWLSSYILVIYRLMKTCIKLNRGRNLKVVLFTWSVLHTSTISEIGIFLYCCSA